MGFPTTDKISFIIIVDPRHGDGGHAAKTAKPEDFAVNVEATPSRHY